MRETLTTTSHPIWAIEKQVWRNGLTELEQHLHTSKVFFDPANPLDKVKSTIDTRTGDIAVEAEFKSAHMLYTPNAIQLAYHAQNADEATYCCSTYLKNGQNWQLITHKRKPVAA